ncbi:MAG: tetratricopeptide repeat protein [Planctomycetes bacterium]|nr:tetratricopeptide repeat protein [Planctomycetota bacterium]
MDVSRIPSKRKKTFAPVASPFAEADDETLTGRKRLLHLGALVLLMAVGVGIYLNSLNGPFIYDDRFSIEKNDNIRHLWPLWKAMSAKVEYPVAGRPLVSLTLAINYAIGGLDVRGYHIFNIAVHVLAGLVLFGVVRRTLLTEVLRRRFGQIAMPMALACALIWTVHPLLSECVNYITQRTESMMGLFYLLTMYCAIRADRGARRRWWFVGAVISCSLGMASKGVMVTAPLMVVLYDLTFGGRPIKRTLRRRMWLYAALACTWIILVLLMYPSRRPTTVGFGLGVSAMDYARGQCRVIVNYLRLAIWPHPLVLDYGHSLPVTTAEAAPYGIVVLVLLSATVLAFFRRPAVGFAGAWFFLILGPTSSFVPIVTEVGADRRMYLPLAGLVVLAAAGGYVLLSWLLMRPPETSKASELAERIEVADRLARRVGVVLVLLIAVALAITTVRRNRDFRSQESIWRSAVKARPDNERAQCSLGAVLMVDGQYDEAIECFRRATRRNDYIKARYNLAQAFMKRGAASGRRSDLDEAEKNYKIVLEAKSDHVKALFNLGRIYKSEAKLDEAISLYRRAVKADPDAPEILYALGRALELKKQPVEAIKQYRKALRNKHDFANAHTRLGGLLAMQGKIEEAMRHFREAIALNDTDPGTLAGAAWVLATYGDFSEIQKYEALRYAKRACELTKKPRHRFLDALAAAYARAGQFPAAIKTAETALKIAVDIGRNVDAERIAKRLELYRQSKPYTSSSGLSDG